jgi:O-antigen/teichoic acid export membrane protein
LKIRRTSSLKSPTRESKDASRQTAQWDARNIFKNYFVVAGTQIGGAIFSLATVWLATRLYGTDGYGSIVAIIAGSQAVQLLTNWTNVALARYGVQEFVETGKISKVFWARTVIFSPNLILVASTCPLWIYWLLALLRLPTAAVSLIILHFIFSVVWLHFQQALQAVKMPRLQGLLIFLERGVIFLFVLFFGFFFKLPWLYAFYAFILSSFIMSVIAWWHIRNMISWKMAVDKDWMKRILAFSVPLIPYSITSFFCTSYLDAFFITKYLSKSELGIYTVAYQINSLLLQFLILVGSLLMPMFVTLRAKAQHHHINQYLESVLPLITLAWGLVIPFFAISVGYFIPMIFGTQFSNLESVVWVFMLGTTFSLPSVIGYSPFATAASAVYISFPLALITASVNVLGNFILIPKWGLVGSSWSTSISAVAGMASIVLLIRWRFAFKISLLFQAILPTFVGLLSFLMIDNRLIASLLISIFTACIILLNFNVIKQSLIFSHSLIRRNIL